MTQQIERKDRDRVYISAEVHDLYKKLTAKVSKEDKDLEGAPFSTMKDVFMWAVGIGVQLGRKKSLTGSPTEQVFFWSTFSEQTDVPLLHAVALADTGTIEVLADRDQILSLAEQYANAGIMELRTRLHEDYREPLWQLVELITESASRAGHGTQAG